MGGDDSVPGCPPVLVELKNKGNGTFDVESEVNAKIGHGLIPVPKQKKQAGLKPVDVMDVFCCVVWFVLVGLIRVDFERLNSLESAVTHLSFIAAFLVVGMFLRVHGHLRFRSLPIIMFGALVASSQNRIDPTDLFAMMQIVTALAYAVGPQVDQVCQTDNFAMQDIVWKRIEDPSEYCRDCTRSDFAYARANKILKGQELGIGTGAENLLQLCCHELLNPNRGSVVPERHARTAGCCNTVENVVRCPVLYLPWFVGGSVFTNVVYLAYREFDRFWITAVASVLFLMLYMGLNPCVCGRLARYVGCFLFMSAAFGLHAAAFFALDAVPVWEILFPVGLAFVLALADYCTYRRHGKGKQHYMWNAHRILRSLRPIGPEETAYFVVGPRSCGREGDIQNDFIRDITRYK